MIENNHEQIYTGVPYARFYQVLFAYADEEGRIIRQQHEVNTIKELINKVEALVSEAATGTNMQIIINEGAKE